MKVIRLCCKHTYTHSYQNYTRLICSFWYIFFSDIEKEIGPKFLRTFMFTIIYLCFLIRLIYMLLRETKKEKEIKDNLECKVVENVCKV